MPIFNEKRVAFVAVGDHICLQDPNSIMSCRAWMKEVLKVPDSYTDTVTRGYILDKRIHFFVGPNYSIAPNISAVLIDSAVEAWRYLYPEDSRCSGVDDLMICNGCHVGKEGEQWPPILVYGLKGEGFWSVAE